VFEFSRARDQVTQPKSLHPRTAPSSLASREFVSLVVGEKRKSMKALTKAASSISQANGKITKPLAKATSKVLPQNFETAQRTLWLAVLTSAGD